MLPNRIKQGIAAEKRVRGVHLTFPQPSIIEALATANLDYIYLDGEHGCFDLHDIEAACIAAERHQITPIARIPDRSASTICKFLDRGATGLVVPHVHSLAHAQEVIDSAFFAPIGNRSFGGGRPHFVLGIEDKPQHLKKCNDTLSLSIMIESRAGMEAAADIAALPNVDYLSFGMMDLAQDLGAPGNPGHPDVVAAVDETSRRIRDKGKPVREDFMDYAWINEILAVGTQALLDTNAVAN